MPIELEKLDQPLLGVDAIRGEIEELAVFLHDKKLSQPSRPYQPGTGNKC
jgi:hypothetical protein